MKRPTTRATRTFLLPTSRCLAVAALAVVTLTVAPGCSHFVEPKFNRPDGVASEPVFMVPFREPGERLWYGESQGGSYVAEAFRTWAMMNASPHYAEGEPVRQLLRIVQDWTGQEIEVDTWVELAGPTGIRYLIVGQIEKITLSRPESVGIVDAWIQASYTVIDVELRRTVWERRSFSIPLGKGRDTDMPLLTMGVDEAQIRKRLLTRLGQEIGQDLYGYEEDFKYN